MILIAKQKQRHRHRKKNMDIKQGWERCAGLGDWD